MAYYVPLGPRGGVLRLGTFVIGIVGSLIYRKHYRRRNATFTNPTLPSLLLDTLHAE